MNTPLAKLEAFRAGYRPLTTPYTPSEKEMMQAALEQITRDGIQAVLVKVPGGLEIWRKGMIEKKY